MIRPTNITDVRYVGEGWLKRYMDAVSVTAFPISFHILNAYFGLSSLIGRRAKLRLDGFSLYPPVFIFLLGRSGVGKGQSMNLMRDLIIRPAAELIPGFKVMDPHQFTSAGILKGFRDEQARSGLEVAEGAVTVDEASAVFTSRVGTETMDEFIIKAHERKDIETITQRDGELVVRNFTAGMAFGSTVGKIRRAMSAEAFGGGLMHRFLIAHELEKQPINGTDVDPAVMKTLAGEALEIRNRAPQEMGIDEAARRSLRRIANKGQQEALINEEMSGYWNRAYAITAQIAITKALSENRTVITADDIRECSELLTVLVTPLVQLVRELRFGPHQQVLFQLAETIFHLDARGMDFNEFKQSIPATNSRSLKDSIKFLEELGLIWIGKRYGEGHVWATKHLGLGNGAIDERDQPDDHME